MDSNNWTAVNIANYGEIDDELVLVHKGRSTLLDIWRFGFMLPTMVGEGYSALAALTFIILNIVELREIYGNFTRIDLQ